MSQQQFTTGSLVRWVSNPSKRNPDGKVRIGTVKVHVPTLHAVCVEHQGQIFQIPEKKLKILNKSKSIPSWTSTRRSYEIRARNVTARREQNYLVSTLTRWPHGTRLPVEHFDEIVFDQVTNEVIAMEKAR